MDEYLNQQTRANSFSFNEVAQFLFVLFVAKFFKSFGIYLCYDLLKQIHIVQLLFFVSLVATLFFIVLQRPFSSSTPSASSSSDKGARASSQRTATTATPAKSLSRYLYFRILKYSFVQTVIRLLWLFGLTQCGPLRTTLIFEQSDIVILCALKAIFLSQTTPTRSRGVLLLLTGTLILLAFDYDAIRAKVCILALTFSASQLCGYQYPFFVFLDRRGTPRRPTSWNHLPSFLFGRLLVQCF